MGILGGLEDSILEWFDQFGIAALALLSFTEAIIQPVPPDLMYIPQLINAQNSMSVVILLWLVVTISSVAGSLVGYWLGKRWGRTLLDKYSSGTAVIKLEVLTQRYGTFGIFIAAFSPIPYKVFGWVAGMGEMKKRPFIIAGLLGRGLRFGIEALLIGLYGEKVLDGLAWFVDHEVFMGASLLAIIGIGIVSWSWWQGLAPVAEEE